MGIFDDAFDDTGSPDSWEDDYWGPALSSVINAHPDYFGSGGESNLRVQQGGGGGLISGAAEDVISRSDAGLDFRIDINKLDFDFLDDFLHAARTLASTEVVDSVLQQWGDDTVDIMFRRAPFLTGNLRDNITFTRHPNEIQFTSVAIEEDTGFDYAYIQEFGGRTGTGGYIREKNYFRRTLDARIAGLWDNLKNTVEVILKNPEIRP